MRPGSVRIVLLSVLRLFWMKIYHRWIKIHEVYRHCEYGSEAADFTSSGRRWLWLDGSVREGPVMGIAACKKVQSLHLVDSNTVRYKSTNPTPFWNSRLNRAMALPAFPELDTMKNVLKYRYDFTDKKEYNFRFLKNQLLSCKIQKSVRANLTQFRDHSRRGSRYLALVCLVCGYSYN